MINDYFILVFLSPVMLKKDSCVASFGPFKVMNPYVLLMLKTANAILNDYNREKRQAGLAYCASRFPEIKSW